MIAAPTRQIAVNAKVARRVPIRSTMMPPISTMRMLGKL